MLTKADIVNTIFSKALYGYSRSEVDQFVQEVAEEIGNRDEEIESLNVQVSSLQSRLEEYEQREQDLRDALLTTHKMVDDIKRNAEKEAEVIVEQAKVKARDVVAEAQNRATSIEEECLQLQKQRIQFKAKLKSLLDVYQRFLQWEEADEASGSEDRGQRTEDRGQKTEDRGRKTEGRGQRTED